MKQLVLICLLLVKCLSLCAQQSDLLFHHLDSRSGLGDPKLWKLYKDSYGLLWIASENGLTCFDGTSCKVYRHSSLDTNSICANYITTIIEDKNRDLWIGTQNGLARYNRQQDNFTNVKKLVADRPLATNFYSFPFFIDDKNYLWAYLGGEIFKIDIAARTATFVSTYSNGYVFVNQPFYTPLKQFVNRNVNGMFITNMTDSGAVSKGYFMGSRRDGDMPVSYIHQVLMQHDSLYWVCSDMGLIALNPINGAYTAYATTQDGKAIAARCMVAMPGNPNQYLIGTSAAGLQIFDATQRKFTGAYEHDANDPQSLSGNNIAYLLTDDDQNIFALLPGRGLDYTNVNSGLFSRAFSKSASLGQGVSNNVNAMAYQAGHVFVASEASGILVKRVSDGGGLEHLLSGQNIEILFSLDDGSVLAYDAKGNFYRIKNQGNSWYADALSLEGKQQTSGKLVVNDIRYIGDNHLLVATASGMASMQIVNGKVQLDWMSSVNETVEWPNFQRILPLSSSKVLLQTHYTNMYSFDWKDGALRNGKEIARTPFQTNGAVVYNGGLWLATSSGLWVVDSISTKLRQVALQNYYCTGMLADKQGNMWVATTNGLLRFDPESRVAKRFTPEEGLQHFTYNTNSLIWLPDGRIAAGGINGINVFLPEKIKDTKEDYDVYVTLVEVNENVFGQKNPMMLKELELDYTQNTIAFRITPVSYGNPERLPIHYLLEGYETKPITILGEGLVRYPQLPSGTYTFKAYGSSDGHVATIKIIINPPFWATWWFRTILVIIVALLIVWLIRARIKGIKKRQLQRLQWMIQSQEEERKRIARDLHDDFGARLSTLKLYMQAANKEEQHNQKKILGHTTDMVDTAIAELRNILFNLSPKTLDENGLKAALHDMADNINRLKLIVCDVDTRAFNRRIRAATEYSIYRVCQELINNTIKHANAQHVYISMVEHGDMLVFLYEDDGRGFDTNQSSRGYGWNNIEAHVQSLGGTLLVDAAPGRGVAVTIQIPKTANYD